MSYSTIIAVYPNDKTEEVEELSNSHGTAPVVWEGMAARYLGVTKSYDHPNKGWMQLGHELWDLWKRRDIPVEHRMVFMFTFDRATVSAKDYPFMASSIKKWLQDFPSTNGHANHWPKLLEFFEGNPPYPAVGLYATSVSENPFQGKWNEEKEDYDPPNWDEIYDIKKALDSLESAQ